MNAIDLIEIKHLKGEQVELAETIGIEAYRKLVNHYGGEKLFISRLDSIIAANKTSIIKEALKTASDEDILAFFCITRRELERIKHECR